MKILQRVLLCVLGYSVGRPHIEGDGGLEVEEAQFGGG